MTEGGLLDMKPDLPHSQPLPINGEGSQEDGAKPGLPSPPTPLPQGEGKEETDRVNPVPTQVVRGRVSVYAPDWDPYTGYGRLALELVHRLNGEGVRVNALGSAHEQWAEVQHPHVRELLNRPVQLTGGGILLGYPTLFEEYGALAMAEDAPRVAITMFESTKLPDGWADALNKCSAVVVPAKFLVNVLQKCGVRRPIHVVPLGISETFHFVKRPHYPEVFTFLCLGDGGIRKGWDVAYRAFVQAFGKDNPKVKLIIKARKFRYEPVENNVEVIQDDYSEAQLMELYTQVHCYVFPTRGEGFGLTPREAAATGLPVIATNWGGTADNLPAWGFPIKAKMVTAWGNHPSMAGLGKWAEPDVDELAKLMVYVASKPRFMMWHQPPRSTVESQDKRVAMRVRKLYSWSNFAHQVWGIWEDAVAAGPKLSIAARREKRRGKPHPRPLSKGEGSKAERE